MEVSIFFAMWLGLYCLFMALLMAFRRKEIEKVVSGLYSSPTILYLAGAFNLALGLVIAILHPVWMLNWQGVITVLGYLSIVKGVLRMGFPENCKKCELSMMKYYWVMVGIVAVIGVYLTYYGFTFIRML